MTERQSENQLEEYAKKHKAPDWIKYQKQDTESKDKISLPRVKWLERMTYNHEIGSFELHAAENISLIIGKKNNNIKRLSLIDRIKGWFKNASRILYLFTDFDYTVDDVKKTIERRKNQEKRFIEENK